MFRRMSSRMRGVLGGAGAFALTLSMLAIAPPVQAAPEPGPGDDRARVVDESVDARAAGMILVNGANRCIWAASDPYDVWTEPYASCGWLVNDRWTLVGSGPHQIKNSATGKCLVAQGTTNEAKAATWNCGSYADQYWRHVDLGNGWFQLKNVNSNKCLVARSTQYTAVQYTCGSYSDQKWKWTSS